MVRLLKLEALESRFVFDSSWHNGEMPCDVDRSGTVAALDALIIVNELNQHGARALVDPLSEQFLFDTNNDQLLTPMDVLLVINLINQYHDPMHLTSDAANSDLDANGVVVQDQIQLVGVTIPNSVVSLSIEGGSSHVATADNAGHFQIVLPVALGSNLIEVSAKDARGRTSEPFQLSVNRGDLVHDWNASLLNAVRQWTTTSDDPVPGRIVSSQPPLVARNLAMIHTAMFDAVNAFSGEYAAYLQGLPSAPAGASQEAAIAGAAFTVASALYPDSDEQAIWDATLTESLAMVLDANALEAGFNFGKLVGQAMLSNRVADGSAVVASYENGTEPGDWQRTAPGFLPPLLPNWPNVQPFGGQAISDFRPAAPPALTSGAYALAVDEVMQIGALNSTLRTAEQTQIALFWADGGGTATPPGHWNRIAADVSMPQDRGLLENTRLFALLNIALADAGISAWDAKYTFDLWRPIDAIRQAETDGNAATVPDATWLPLIGTPPFPTYVSGHSTFSGAAATVLAELLGNDVAFSDSIDPQNAPAQQPLATDMLVSRSFTSFWQAAEEAGVSRIYGGIHFSFDNTAGLESGRAIGLHVVEHLLPKST